MKKLIVILQFLALVVGFVFASALFSSCSEKKIEVINQVTNKMSVDTIALTSCKKKQACEFSKLIRKLKGNPDFLSRIEVDLSNGCDPIGMKKPPATIEQLSKWASFDFIYLEFPDGFWDEQPGILSIHYDNYDKKNPEFFAKIRTVRKTSYGFSERSIPYYMAKTGKGSIPEIEKQEYVLEAIRYAIYAIGIEENFKN